MKLRMSEFSKKDPNRYLKPYNQIEKESVADFLGHGHFLFNLIIRFYTVLSSGINVFDCDIIKNI